MKSEYTISSRKLEKEAALFFEYANAGRLGRNLRNLLLSYLTLQHDGHSMNMDDLLTDLQFLFDLLDAAADEQDTVPRCTLRRGSHHGGQAG